MVSIRGIYAGNDILPEKLVIFEVINAAELERKICEKYEIVVVNLKK